MARITSYSKGDVSLLDKLIGTDFENDNVTVNMPVASIIDLAVQYFATNGGGDAINQSLFDVTTSVDGLTTTVASYTESINVITSDNAAMASRMTTMEAVFTTEGDGSLSISSSKINNFEESIASAGFASAQSVTDLTSSVQGISDDLTVNYSTTSATQSLITQATEDKATSQSVTDLTSTVSNKPNIFRQNYAPATTEPAGSLWYNTLEGNKLYILTTDGDWEETDDSRIGPLVESSATATQTLQTHATNISNNSTFATNLAGSFGTFDAQGNITSLSESFANSVMSRESATNYADAQDLTELGAIVSTKPNVYRQDDAPSIYSGSPSEQVIPDASIWYDTDDDNKVYIVDEDPNNTGVRIWTLTDDSRIGATASKITSMSAKFGSFDANNNFQISGSSDYLDTVITTVDTNSATASKVSNLGAELGTFDSNNNFNTSLSADFKTAVNNEVDANSATAGYINNLSAAVGIDKLDGTPQSQATALVNGGAGTPVTATLDGAVSGSKQLVLTAADSSIEVGQYVTYSTQASTINRDLIWRVEAIEQENIFLDNEIYLENGTTVSFTGNTSITVDNISGTIREGFQIKGTGITPGTFVSAVNGNNITLSLAENLADDTPLEFLGIYAAVKETANVVAKVDGTLESTYGLQVDANGNVAGMKLLANNEGSEVSFLADSFKIYNGSNTSTAPFEVVNGVVKIKQGAIGTVSFGDLADVPASFTTTVIYADSANGTNASTTKGTRTHVAFYNGAWEDGDSVSGITFDKIAGTDGTSVSILGTLSSTNDLPASGNTVGDGYLIDGDLYVWDGSNWNNVGTIEGPAGAAGAAGADAYTVLLSNESHTLQTNTDGTVDYAGSGTNILAFKGGTELNGRVSGTPGTGQFSVTAVANGISLSTPTSTGNPIIYPNFSSMTGNTASITYTINLEDNVTVTKKQSFSKALQGATGATGAAGVNAKSIKLIPSSHVINYTEAGGETDTITFTTEIQGASAGVTYQFYVDNVSQGAASATSTFTLPDNLEPANGASVEVEVELKSGSTILARDSVTIFGVQDGHDAITSLLTNASHVVSADNSGTVTSSLASAGGSFKVFVGATDVSSSCTFSVVTSSGITTAITSGGTYSISAVSADNGTATYQAVVPSAIAKTAANVTLTQTYSISKSKAGTDGINGAPGSNGSNGADAKVVKLNPSKHVINYSIAGAETDTITFNAASQNVAGTATYRYYIDNVAQGAASSTSTFTLPDASEPASGDSVVVEVELYDDGTLVATDEVTIYGVQDGNDAPTAFLTNAAHVVSAAADGAVSSYTGSGGTFKVFVGNTDVTTSCTFAVDSQSAITASINSSGVYTISNLQANNGFAVFEATIPAATANAASDVILTAEYSISKSITGATGAQGPSGADGIDGADGAYVSFVYKKSASQPVTPSGGSYNGTSETIPTGWTDDPTASVNDTEWVSSTRYHHNKVADTWSNTGWSTPAIYYQKGATGDTGATGATGDTGPAGPQGTTGADGLKTASGIIFYQSGSATRPSTPSTSGVSYNFSNGTFTGLNSNWSKQTPEMEAGTASNAYWTSSFNVIESSSGSGTGAPSFATPVRAFAFNQVVTFSALNTSGSTIINGDNITTGQIKNNNYIPGPNNEFSAEGMAIDLDSGSIHAENFYIDEDGNAEFKGTHTSGSIGSWVVDNDVLRDADSKILLDPANKKIELKDAAGQLKAFISANEDLTSTSGADIIINSSNRPGSNVGPTYPPASSGTTSSSYIDGTPTYSSSAGSFTPTVSGQYELFNLFDTTSIPTIDLTAVASSAGLNTPVSGTTGNPNGNLIGDYHNQAYGSSASPKSIQQRLSLVIEKVSNGEEVGDIWITTASRTSAVNPINKYYWNSSSNSWDYYLPSFGVSAGGSQSKRDTPISATAYLEAGVAYRIRYKSIVRTSSGYLGYLDGTNWMRSYTFYTVTNSGNWVVPSVSSLDQAFGLAIPSNFVEASGGGVQVVSNSQKYVSITRKDINSSGDELITVNNGYASFQRSNPDELSLEAEGYSRFQKRVDVGTFSFGNTNVNTDWPGLRTRMFTILTKYVGSGSSSSSSPLDLAYEIRSGGSTLYLRPDSSRRYYTLPHKSSAGTTTDADYVPDGTVITLINTSNTYSGYVKGLFGAKTSGGSFAGTKEYYTLKHGDTLTLQYFNGNSAWLQGWKSGDTKGWFILSYAYNQEAY